ncbi:hypothetical protein PSPO01_11682 [Paraphaeosphaeria sporulosa]
MAPKRTYNRHNMSIVKPDTDALIPSDPDNSCYEANKRRKPTPPSPANTMHHSDVMSSGGRPKSVNLKNAPSKPNHSNTKSFSGPTSLSNGEMDPFESVIKLAQETKAPQKQRSMSLYRGGHKAINSISAQLKSRRREGKKGDVAHILISDDSSSEGGIQLSESIELSPDDMDTTRMDSSSAMKATMRGGSESAAEASARIFGGREYTAPQTAPPRRTFCGARIKGNSVQAQAWSANQSSSPLLRLPASVRRSVFEYALGGNSIEFGFVTFLVDKTADGTKKYTPYFQYTSNVYPARPCEVQRNPFHGTPIRLHSNPDTTGMTLLNGVCRQLYLETYKLPYALNDFYFNSGNALFNFIVNDDRLQPQQLKSIKSIVVLHKLPVPSVLEKLPNLQQVRLMAPNLAIDIGFYKVVRDGKMPELVKFIPTSKNATGKLNRPGMRGGGGDDKKSDPKKAYLGAYGGKYGGSRSERGYGRDDTSWGYDSGKYKNKWSWGHP